MKFWKVLFWFFAFACLLDFIAIPFSDSIEPEDLMASIIGAILLIPYYGFAYQDVIGWKRLWIALFILQLPIFINTFWSVPIRLFDAILAGDIFVILVMLIVLALAVLLLIPPFKYAFQSEHLWKE